ncbi:MAG TPA: hypothetical protein VKA67_13335 [Verrucomicrobiae bacterium]|nr:hypothetical protein [Verrucomicrobiae bacterium]
MKNILFRNLAQTFALVFVVTLCVGDLEAHEVVWFENPFGIKPTNAMVLYYGPDECGNPDYGEIGIVPSVFEPCTVVVNVDQPSSPTISVHFEQGVNTANQVWIEVDVEGLGPATVNTVITGEWHATGLPANNYCDAISPNYFSVPVVVKRSPFWIISRIVALRMIKIDTGGVLSGLRSSSTLNGRWLNVGMGTSFTLKAENNAQFFKGTTKLGGALNGTITDPMGNSQIGLSLGLLYGGSSATTDYNGYFILPSLPRGWNMLKIEKPITFTDPSTGSNRTENVGVNVVLPATNSLSIPEAKLTVDMDAGSEPGTNICDCTPWSAIGTGTLDGAQRPVYYAGGAFPPQSGAADCDPPQVTVTPPGGAAFTITAGDNLHQNSGRNPASGIWTVTTTICGTSKSCSVTVP